MLMRRVSEYIEREPGATRRGIRRDVSGKNDYVDLALGRLIEEGFVECRSHGQSHRHYCLRPFDEGEL